jgi:galactonate dehydratase
LHELAPAALHWFECPIAETHAHWPAMRRLRAATREQGVLLAAAETQVGLASFQTLFDEALYDVVMPDIKYCGGPLEMLKIAHRAAEHGVLFSPHNPSGPVCTWHSLQIAALAPECAMLELQFEEKRVRCTSSCLKARLCPPMAAACHWRGRMDKAWVWTSNSCKPIHTSRCPPA